MAGVYTKGFTFPQQSTDRSLPNQSGLTIRASGTSFYQGCLLVLILLSAGSGDLLCFRGGGSELLLNLAD